MALGQLVVTLGLDAADFISGMSKSEAQSKRFGQALDRNIAAGIIKAEIALRALGAAARTTADVFQSLTVGAADFKDLEETTGASAESLASLAVAAATAGVEMGSVGAAANKLTKNLVGVDDESKAAGAALKALNLNISDFKNLDPVAQYEAVGKALGNFADGSEKVAVAQALFGKSGAEQLKVFKALEEAGGRQTILTQRQIELADGYADAQAKAGAQLRLYAQAAASEAIPALTDLTAAATDLIKEFIGVDEQTGKLRANNGVKEFAEGVVDSFALAADAVQHLSRTFEAGGKLIGAVGAFLKADSISQGNTVIREFLSDMDELDNRLMFSERLAKRRAAAAAGASDAAPFSDARFESGRKPKLNFNGVDETAGARLKAQLDGQIKAIRDFADQQRDAFEFANRFVKGTYDDGLISLRSFFDAEHEIRANALQATLEALNKERAALEAALPKTKAAERIGIENKIAEVVAKRGEAVQKAGRDGILSAQEEARSILQLQQRYDDLRASVMELSGDSAGAARIRISQQVEEARKLVKQQGGDPALVDQFREQLQVRAQITEQEKAYRDVIDRLRNAEEEIAIARDRGSKNELEQLSAVGIARRKSVEELEGVVAAMRAVANASGDPALINHAEEARLALERLKAEADPLAKKFSDMFENSFGDALGDFVTGTKTAKDAFRSFANDVVNQMLRMSSKNVAQSLFGEGGAFGDWGSKVGSLFGTTKSSNSSGSSGIWDSVGSFIGSIFGGGKAIGGPTMPNTLYQVGERRPEVFDDGSRQWLLTGSRRGRVDPSPQIGGGGRSMAITNNFILNGPADRRTQNQIAGAQLRGAAAINARFN